MRKMMSTVHAEADGSFTQYTKGAPDEVIRRCDTYLKNGEVLPLDEAAVAEILEANRGMTSQALRVLGAALRKYDNKPESFEAADLEQKLTFIGLTGMIDPIRPEVLGAIEECKDAGIRAIMITGDHRDTAVAIAKQLGIIQDETEAITGAQLSEDQRRGFRHGSGEVQRICPGAARAQGAHCKGMAGQGLYHGHDGRRRERRAQH